MAFTLAPTTESGIATHDEQQDAYVAALKRELLGYERSGKKERAAAVKAELVRVGALPDEKGRPRSKATAEAPEDAEQASASPLPPPDPPETRPGRPGRVSCFPGGPMRWRRIRPPAQTSDCSGCGRRITERRRRPCPACGSINRIVGVSVGDSIALSDRVS